MNSVNKYHPSLVEKALLLRYAAGPNLLSKKKKLKKSTFKVLYQLHLLGKNVRKGRWTDIHTSKETISKWSGVGIRQLTTFINDRDCFPIFGECVRRPGTSNLYRLHAWVEELFDAFERVGMMRRFGTDFDIWFRTFCKRFDGVFLPLLEKGLSLYEVVNRLCTKIPVKVRGSNPVKVHATTASQSTTPSGTKSKYEQPPNPIFRKLSEVGFRLDRFGLAPGDQYQMLNRYSPKDNLKACDLMETFIKRAIMPKSPIRLYQSCINRIRKVA
ncbi:hypothetical protein UFOVP255_41 [uncultured Caudovirales phage]|uniref:Uncharacterized protein n=1 Tax=uncultured Caudovirales phage TaxID=2100421 RepID=A0A6J5LF17_9CAUD|nr:hypothetical protein UFOVP255_41 [uncultured Caudovirales phage]